MDLVPVREGLWRWTARHPDWEPDQPHDSPGDWPAVVGCVAYRAPEALVLIDPLVPEGDWSDLDLLVESVGSPVHVLVTIPWHERSSTQALERFSGTTAVPTGVTEIGFPRADETMFWIPEHRALVPGDRILGFGVAPGSLRVCPDSWLRYIDPGITGVELRAELQKLLELPVELVLVSHGEPVLEGADAALESALAA